MSESADLTTPSTWVLLEGTARIALSREGSSSDLTTADPQVVAELRALTGGGDGCLDIDDTTTESTDAAVDDLIKHLRHHVRYHVTVERAEVSTGTTTRPVLCITSARRGRGVGDLLTDVAGYLIAENSTVADTTVSATPWLSVTSVAAPADPSSSTVQFHSVTHIIEADPSAGPHAQVVLTLGQRQVTEIAAAALTASRNRDSGQDPHEAIAASTAATAAGTGSADISSTPLDDVDVLLAGILRSVVAQIEQNPLDEDEAGDQAVLNDREAVINTLVMAATMLEEHTVHPNLEVTNLVITNLRQLAHRSEATIPEHVRANPAAALEHLSDDLDPEAAASATNPAQLSLAVAAELAADRIAQL